MGQNCCSQKEESQVIVIDDPNRDEGQNNIQSNRYNSRIAPESDYDNAFESNEAIIFQEENYIKWTTEQAKATHKDLGEFDKSLLTQKYEEFEKKDPFKIQNGKKQVIYRGQVKDENTRHGFGQQWFQDGSIYEGEFQDNKIQGKGRLIHPQGDYYFGDWKDEKAWGFGKYTHIDGSSYEGEWREDKQHGKGIEKWCDGAVYEGQYQEGMKNGIGKFRWEDGSIYEGPFRNNDIETGQGENGKYTWNDGRKYNGEWKRNQMEGFGEFEWPDGRKYIGKYCEDKKQGVGIFQWQPNKDNKKKFKIYIGQWNQGKQEGYGFYKNDKEVWQEGVWKNGKRNGDWLQKGAIEAALNSDGNPELKEILGKKKEIAK